MLNRRAFIRMVGLAALWPNGCIRRGGRAGGVWVNDVHSQLTRTRVAEVLKPVGVEQIQEVIYNADVRGEVVSMAGGRHAMGGQQFGTGTLLLDLVEHDAVIGFDREAGIVEVSSGIQWPDLVNFLVAEQSGDKNPWGIKQKQTGTDRLTIGGTLAANAHGRGLNMKPIVADIESFDLVTANGDIKHCSRTENSESFRLVVGGYGLFGVVASARLRLAPRRKMERVVELIDVDDLIPAFEGRRQEGFLYGDCQYATDETSRDYIRKGVFSCYRPVDPGTPIPEGRARLSPRDWRELIYLAHVDKGRAFEQYSRYYLSTSGQIYWSDLHQLSTYMDDYHRALDTRLHANQRATEIITEVYVPRQELSGFLGEVREDFRRNGVNVIYGTIRLIEKDDESFLPWAKQSYVCVIFNLHTKHTRAGIGRSANAFRRLIDMAAKRGGSYFLTYHRFATRDQIETCYPRFVDFLRKKKRYDPQERFQSDWYRFYQKMFSDKL